ncbi:MAG: hypothetical protein Q8O45_06330 [Desulfurivibrionaceae bacterium]|nr:hypothetical protein [Desulfurivibrionaceae bacterium]
MTKKQRQIPLFENLPADARDYVRVAFSARRLKKAGEWRGMVAVPPGSLLESIILEFQLKTNIALEIPLATFMHYVSGALIFQGSKVIFQGNAVEADFWSIVLAPSGGGKTWTQQRIGAGLEGVVPVMQSGAASAAAWLQEFAERPRSLWIRDEFFQLMKGIEQPAGPLADLKGYLLQIYDNAAVERVTKKDAISIEKPVLSLLGFTALQPFTQGMSPESLLDGFAQRFGFVLAMPDAARPWREFPFWSVDSQDWAERFKSMTADLQAEYHTSPAAEEVFAAAFKKLSGGLALDESFFRRIMWRGHKYALVYHVMRGLAADPVLTKEDYGWAARLLEMQLADAAEVLEMCSQSDISRAIDVVEEIVQRLRQAGQPITTRAVISKTRLITSASMARFIFSILGISEETARGPRRHLAAA